ncbi:MAG: amino acid-binding protein [Magnetococcales bacterium]|nr:amino acid-binding protein [Magnetococcales bacterium]
MKHCALLTVFGQDRPGIVAQVTRVLFETGCNIADSSMTRLGGEFTVMLVVQIPEGLSPAGLYEKLTPVVKPMALDHHIKELDPKVALNPNATLPERECIISVLGADQPGIVYRVTEVIQETGGSVTDLHTQVIGSSGQPIYSVIIETEYSSDIDSNIEAIQERLDRIAKELQVEISVRPIRSDPL